MSGLVSLRQLAATFGFGEDAAGITLESLKRHQTSEGCAEISASLGTKGNVYNATDSKPHHSIRVEILILSPNHASSFQKIKIGKTLSVKG